MIAGISPKLVSINCNCVRKFFLSKIVYCCTATLFQNIAQRKSATSNQVQCKLNAIHKSYSLRENVGWGNCDSVSLAMAICIYFYYFRHLLLTGDKLQFFFATFLVVSALVSLFLYK